MAAPLLSRAPAAGLIAVLAATSALVGCTVASDDGTASAADAPSAEAFDAHTGGDSDTVSADATLSIVTVPFALDRPAAQPGVVADPARHRFVLSWQERDAQGCAILRTATLGADGAVGEPRDVARGCDWFVNWADFPSVAIADNGDWWTWYLQKSGPSTHAYDIRLLRSEDEGRSWSAPITPYDDRTPTEHGFVSMVPMGGDRMLLAWLDGRNTLAPAVGAGHDAPAGAHGAGHGAGHGHAHSEGPMSLRSVEVGRDFVLRHAQEVDARVCSCCPTDLARRGNGAVLVYRDRSEDEIRDVYAAEYRDGRWTPGAAVRADGWRIAACPVNGPALAASGDRLAALWPTMAGATLSVKGALVGATGPATVLEAGDAVLGRPDLAPWPGGHWLAVWLGAGPDRAQALRVASLSPSLAPASVQDVALLPPGRGTGMPRIASLGDVAVLAWTAPREGADAGKGSSTVQLARVTLARPPTEGAPARWGDQARP